MNPANFFEQTTGTTLLHSAIIANKVDVIKTLITDENINAFNNNLQTPLLLALNNIPILEILLEHPSINVNFNPVNKLTPLCAISYYGYPTLDILLKHPKLDHNKRCNGITALMYAVRGAHVDHVSRLLEEPLVNVNAVSDFGDSAIVFACNFNTPGIYSKMVEIVNLLLERTEIDINLSSEFTAFDHATSWRYTEIVALLNKKNPMRFDPFERKLISLVIEAIR